MTSTMIPVAPNLPHPLGRHVNHDPRNRSFRALVSPPRRAIKPNKTWWTSVVYDQGDSPSCTAQACVGVMNTNPFRPGFAVDRLSYDEPAERLDLYDASKIVDPFPGVDYDGTSTDAPFKVLRNAGAISGWKWLFGEDELREWVTWYGPAVVGTLWLMDMFDPSPLTGMLTVAGEIAGGHAYRIVQHSTSRDAYRIVNSWGRGWGQNGRAWIRTGDLAGLLANDGDAVTIG